MLQQEPEVLSHFSKKPWTIPWPERQKVCLETYKPCLMYNHEDHSLIPFREPIEGLGKSHYQFSVLIMRSLKNMLASRLYENPQWNLRKVQANTRQIPSLYREYADEFLGNTHYLTFTPVKIWFDLWFTSQPYRVQKANEMGLKNTDSVINYMAAYRKKGSTFDTVKAFGGHAQDMDVLYRYKKMANNKVYQRFIKKYPDLLVLSDKIHEKALSEIH